MSSSEPLPLLESRRTLAGQLKPMDYRSGAPEDSLLKRRTKPVPQKVIQEQSPVVKLDSLIKVNVSIHSRDHKAKKKKKFLIS